MSAGRPVRLKVKFISPFHFSRESRWNLSGTWWQVCERQPATPLLPQRFAFVVCASACLASECTPHWSGSWPPDDRALTGRVASLGGWDSGSALGGPASRKALNRPVVS